MLENNIKNKNNNNYDYIIFDKNSQVNLVYSNVIKYIKGMWYIYIYIYLISKDKLVLLIIIKMILNDI